MEPNEAIEQLRASADQIARVITGMHPIVPKLQNAPAQGEMIKALFELTKQVEVVKKHLLRLQKGDDSRVL